MELRDALAQIAEIRRQMAKSDVFRGYRAAPVALSGALALAGAAIQPFLVSDPAGNIVPYLALWSAMAALSVGAVAMEMAVRMYWTQNWTHFEPARLAVEQFVPAVIAGLLLTVVIVRHVPESVPLLPGLWQIVFSLGIFASARLLPKPIFGVAAFYLVTGTLLVMWSHAGWAMHPWCMGLPFAVGQLSAAAILYWTLERRHD
jgi:hypothetical protein